MISIQYLIEKFKEFFKPKLKLAPPMPRARKPRAKSTPAKKTTAKKVIKK